MEVIRKYKMPRELPILLFLIAMCAVLATTKSTFLSSDNLRAMGTDAAGIGILAVGMTAVIITGGIDLSVAAMLALSALVGGGLISGGQTAAGCGATLATGVACGAFNGGLITLGRMPPIIATLGALYIIQSTATLYSGGQVVYIDNRLSLLGGGFVPLVVTLMVFVAGHVVMRFTRLGRHVYAIGGNEESARLAGISPARIKMAVYMGAGLLAGLAALVTMGINNTFQANDVSDYMLGAIAAVVIGGTSIMGGEGSVPGTMIGVGISTVLRNGAILVGLDARWTQAVIGAAIVIAAIADRLRRR
ncbi:MAG: ABC transporter permease [Armatimonadetes bacterium]|jgi:ribose transport system permease protein|nr:ABC transporter permease [Armatimonadota bacterium]